ncbi:MAG TPA: aspartate-semialdehyde dehydrogenase [Candidatus Methylacidiphilales bacterium]|nr:aspartate-semialdehyde dehydrogenase [Candidatus Methylacidiphilales bacterium]
MTSYRIAVVGATGAVGQEVLRTLERRDFPLKSLKLLASARSVGKKVQFQGQPVPVEELRAEAFEGIDYAIFSAGASRSRQFAEACAKAGAVMIDNSSAFRMRPDVPLVVPEINAGDLKQHQGIIAVPNCSAIILGVPLWPLHQAAQIERIIVSTYQSASGAGAQAMAELEEQTRAYAAGQPLKREVFPHQIAFNVFSHNTAVAANGYNEEENKVIEETRKIFHEPQLPIVATCIRVPVLRAHSESVVIETKRSLSPEEAREILARTPGVKVVDDREKNHFPMPLEASGQFDVLVGRIRRDLSHSRGLALFISGDQLLKGAAWNAVQILEQLTGQGRP